MNNKFSSNKQLCPCGKHVSFVPLLDNPTGGKCWNVECGQKYFQPTNGYGYNTHYTNTVAPQQAKVTTDDTYTQSQQKQYAKRFEREHIYFTEDGQNYLFRVVVNRKTDGKKIVWQERWNGNIGFNGSGLVANGTWETGMKGVTTTLYDAPNLRYLQKSKYGKGMFVLILEGEKDVETVKELERSNSPQLTIPCIATTNPQGAGKWKPHYNKLLYGLDCIIIPDNDNAGRNHAEVVKSSIIGYARTVRILKLWEYLPSLPLKGDLTDFFNLGGVL